MVAPGPNVWRIAAIVLTAAAAPAVRGLDVKAQSSFDKSKVGLTSPLQIKCPGGNEKIQVTDVFYKINSCKAVEFRPGDAVSAENLRSIEQCTGKRFCVLRETDVSSPYLSGKPGCPHSGQSNELIILFKCVAQEKIRPLCSSFETTDSEGYLATLHYPMDLNATEGKNPCVCDLRATGSGRVRLTFVELQLGSEASHIDPAACQQERSKQYVQLKSSYGMSTAYYLCAHRYNVHPEPSQLYKLIFENPIGRPSGRLWIEYSILSDDDADMIKVTCYELQTTSLAAKKLPPAMPDPTTLDAEGAVSTKEYDDSSVLAGILAAITLAAVLVVLGAACFMYKRKIMRCRSSTERSALRGVHEMRNSRLLHTAQKPMALIVPTSKEWGSDTEADTDMDVKGYHPFETFMYTKPAKATPVQVDMPTPHMRLPSTLAAKSSREDLCCNDSSSADDRDSSGSYFGTGSNVTTLMRNPSSPAEDAFPPPPPDIDATDLHSQP